MPLELVLTCPGQNFPASEEKSPVLLGWISSNGTRVRRLQIVCSSLRNFLTPKNFGLCKTQIETPPPIFIGVVGQRFAWKSRRGDLGRPNQPNKYPFILSVVKRCSGRAKLCEDGSKASRYDW